MTYRQPPHRRILSLTLLLTTTFAPVTRVSAQDVARILDILKNKPPKETKVEEVTATAPEAPTRPIFVLRDNSLVSGRLANPRLPIRTKFGVLEVPVEELLRVRFARRVPKELSERLEAHVRDLGAEDFDTREAAMAGLRDIGAPAVELIRESTRSKDPEVGARADVLLAELEKLTKDEPSSEEEPGLRGVEDEVQARKMTFRGTILADSFTLETAHGDLLVDAADINAIRFRATGEAKKNVDVTPGFQPPGNWLDTKIDVRKRQTFRIDAAGTCNVSDWGFSSGPDGTTRYRNNSFGNFPTLALIGKIGKQGKPFKVGAKYKARSPSEGRLYLSIIPFQYSPQSVQGRYRAKIKIDALQ